MTKTTQITKSAPRPDKGDRVMVYNKNGRGEVIREGEATIVDITGLDEYVDGRGIFGAVVEFDGDEGVYHRTLWPEDMAEAAIDGARLNMNAKITEILRVTAQYFEADLSTESDDYRDMFGAVRSILRG